jgi:hypothetical protein
VAEVTTSVSALPRWPAIVEADNERMLRWLGHELAHMADLRMHEGLMFAKANPITDPSERLEWAIAAAERGNVSGLRRIVAERIDPRVTRFVNLPTLKQGQHWKDKYVRSNSLLNAAVKDVYRINDLLRERWTIPRGGISWKATRFAAELWLIDEDGNRAELDLVKIFEADIKVRLKSAKRPS